MDDVYLCPAGVVVVNSFLVLLTESFGYLLALHICRRLISSSLLAMSLKTLFLVVPAEFSCTLVSSPTERRAPVSSGDQVPAILFCLCIGSSPMPLNETDPESVYSARV